MFSRVLIANRGEIALRIIQTCREMGIGTVAVYSEADQLAPHVFQADASYCLGPAPSTQSYLNVQRILEVAKESGAEAIHPGYGFLSENPDFVDACANASIRFIGPSASSMRLLGSKMAAKTLARKAGVPVVPGYDGINQDKETLKQEARNIGFPLFIKASAGGGGRGMRVVRDEASFESALESGRREALASFGDDTIILEKLVESTRHVEIQVLADTCGHIIYLGERDCSVQRRHQKVIEEAPSPALDEPLRQRLGEYAVRLATEAGYINAGTVEFVLAPDGNVYFLEVNTRLQVEHPVTEMVTGVDIVREQIRITAGLPLSMTQADVSLRGHSIECRIYAEDAAQDFAPSTGSIELYDPPAGIGIRNDYGVREGSEVTPFYDSMLAKLIAYAESREACIERMLYALEKYRVIGVTTNIPLLRNITNTPEFRAGDITTGFLDSALPGLLTNTELPEDALIGATAAILIGRATDAHNPWTSGPWTPSGHAITIRLRERDTIHELSCTRVEDQIWRFRAAGFEREVHIAKGSGAHFLFEEGNRRWESAALLSGGDVRVSLEGDAYSFETAQGLIVDQVARGGSSREQGSLQAHMPGTIAKVFVTEGDSVEAGQPLVVVEAMKTEHSIYSPYAGTVVRVNHGVGEIVRSGDTLVEIRE